MITEHNTGPRHAAHEVDGPTLPGIAVVVPNSGGRRFAVDPDERPTESLSQTDAEDAFLDGFEESAVEHTAELEALAAVEGTRVTRWLALARFQVAAAFAAMVDAVADTIRWSARWEEDHARTLARLVVATLSALVLAGTAVGWWVA